MTHSYIVDIIIIYIYFLYDAILTTIGWPPGVSAWLHVGETPSGQRNRRFKSIVYKQIKYIMKYQLYVYECVGKK